MKKLKIIFISLLLFFISTETYGQENLIEAFFGPASFGYNFQSEIGGGVSTLYQTNHSKPLFGPFIKYRLYDGERIWFGKRVKIYHNLGASYFFKNEKQSSGSFKAIPKNSSTPNDIDVAYKFTEGISYLMFDIGTDYYLFTNKNESFSIYTGWILGLNIPRYHGNYDIFSYDYRNYTLQTPTNWENKYSKSEAIFKAGINMGFNLYVGLWSSIYLEVLPFYNVHTGGIIPPDFTIDSRFFVKISLGYRYFFEYERKNSYY
ncbi:MAG: hypothetical protein ACOXZK_06205 [Bacteroidales bacterium]|jgi:hypothetical protein